jgi:glycosyltransferase involved in cell wall biosynthesis
VAPGASKGAARLPQVSVVISSYNRSAMLAAALRSALGQEDVDLEVIVVDNGSTDGTQALLASWDDPRLRVIRNEESLGSVGGRNTGIAAATGEWVGMLDDDDLWAPDKLRSQLEAAARTGRDWVYTGCVHIDGNDQIRGGQPPLPPHQVMAELPVRFVLPGGMSNIIWRRDVLDESGLLDPRIPFPADWDVSLRLARKGPPAMVSRPLVAYRQHGANMSRNSALYRRQLLLLERKHADMSRGRHIDWGAQYRFVGSEELRAGARLAALKAYARAVAAGDLSSIPRMVGVILPAGTQRWLIQTALSDRRWLADAERWLRVCAGGGSHVVV